MLCFSSLDFWGATPLEAILSSFDSRLIKVDKAILPLYTSSQVLTRRANSMCLKLLEESFIISRVDIEKALDKIYQLASSQDGIAAEEALILRGYVIAATLITVVDTIKVRLPISSRCIHRLLKDLMQALLSVLLTVTRAIL